MEPTETTEDCVEVEEQDFLEGVEPEDIDWEAQVCIGCD